jgi:hypothetical protein
MRILDMKACQLSGYRPGEQGIGCKGLSTAPNKHLSARCVLPCAFAGYPDNFRFKRKSKHGPA